jgi:hypothetical protein
MTDSARTEHVAREAILNLLSSDEIAKVSTEEAADWISRRAGIPGPGASIKDNVG